MPVPTYAIAIVVAAAVIVLVVVLARRRGRESSAGGERGEAYAKAVGCLIDGRVDDALQHLKQAVKLNPDDVHTYIKLGDLLRKKGETDRAIHLHRELTVRRKLGKRTEAELYRSLARDYVEAGRFPEAKTAAERLLDIDRKDIDALEIIARVHEEMGELDRAYELQQELARKGKRDGPAFLALYRSYIGAAELARGNRARAKKSFESALGTDKNCLPALLYLGDIYYEDGDRRKATEKWVELAERFPQWAYVVYGRLERAYYESGSFGDIEAVYEKVLRERPHDVPTLLAVAEMNQKRGVFDEALRIVSEVLEIDPDCRRARQLLVRIHLEQGDTEAALKDVQAFLEESKPGEGEFVCRECGHRSKEVLIRCPSCRSWNTFLS